MESLQQKADSIIFSEEEQKTFDEFMNLSDKDRFKILWKVIEEIFINTLK